MRRVLLWMVCLAGLAGCSASFTAADGYPLAAAAQGEALYVAQENGLLRFDGTTEDGQVLAEGPAFAVGAAGGNLYYGVYRLASPLPPRALIPVMDIAESQVWRRSLSGKGEAALLYSTADVIKQAYPAEKDKLLCAFCNDAADDQGLFMVSLGDGAREDIPSRYVMSLCLYEGTAYYAGEAGGIYSLNLATHEETPLFAFPAGSVLSLYPCQAGIYFVGFNGQYPDPAVLYRLFLLPWDGSGAKCLGLDFYARQILYADGDWVYFDSPAAIGDRQADLARLNPATGVRETVVEGVASSVYATDSFALYRPDNTGRPWDRASLWRYDYATGTSEPLFESAAP